MLRSAPKNTFLSQSNPRSQAVARRSKRAQKGTELTIAGTAATSRGTSLLLLFVTTHCLHHLWTRLADDVDPPPTTQSLPPDHIATDSVFALRFHSEDKRFCGSQTNLSNQKQLPRSWQLFSRSTRNETGLSRMAMFHYWIVVRTNTPCYVHIEAEVSTVDVASLIDVLCKVV